MTHYRDSDGDEAWLDYDENGNSCHRKESYGVERWSKYNKNGKIVYSKDVETVEGQDSPNIYELFLKYDESDNLIEVSSADGNVTTNTNEYDGDGRIVKSLDSNGYLSTWEYISTK